MPDEDDAPLEYERTIGFADTAGTRATVTCDVDDDEPQIGIALEAGFCGGRGYPTLEAARQFAAAILDAVDHAQEHTG